MFVKENRNFVPKQTILSGLGDFPEIYDKKCTIFDRTWILVAYTKIGRKIDSRCQVFNFLAINGSKTRAQRLINLKIPVLVRSLKSSNVGLS